MHWFCISNIESFVFPDSFSHECVPEITNKQQTKNTKQIWVDLISKFSCHFEPERTLCRIIVRRFCIRISDNHWWYANDNDLLIILERTRFTILRRWSCFNVTRCQYNKQARNCLYFHCTMILFCKCSIFFSWRMLWHHWYHPLPFGKNKQRWVYGYTCQIGVEEKNKQQLNQTLTYSKQHGWCVWQYVSVFF